MAVPWNPVNAAYLLRRAGFGPTAAEVDEFARLGHEAAVSRLVDYEEVDNAALETRLTQLDLDLGNVFYLYYWWVYRMLYTTRPLEEKMTLFWHGHFATSFAKVNDPGFMFAQNQLLRSRAVGSFETMLVEVSRDPAMLFWLDNAFSVKEAPNENYARELMELFSLGIGNYTETDVKEVARCFTGWTYRGTGFGFVQGIHDTGPKTVLGHALAPGRGVEDGLDVCRILAGHPACAPFLARKLWRFFGAGEPPERVRDAMVAAYRANGFSIREMLRTMLLSDEFFARAATDEQIKSPLEVYVGTLRSLEASREIVEFEGFRFFIFHTIAMGQMLFFPPTVKGWDGGRKWVNTSTLLARYNFANAVATIRGPGYQLVDAAALVGRTGATTPEAIVDAFAELLGPLELGAAARRRLADYMRARPDGTPGEFALDEETVDTKVRGLVKLLLSAPEYLVSLKGADPGLVPPVVVSPVFKKGKLVLAAAGSNIQQGARLRVTGEAVSGTETFALAPKGAAKWVVGKRVASAPGGFTFDELAPAGAAVTLVVENPDGGQSAPVEFMRS
jgi:hypothetical protein